MTRASLSLLIALSMLSCSASEERAARLEEALSGTRGERDPATTDARVLPMAGATPHHLRMSGTFVLRQVGAGQGRAIEVNRDVYRARGSAYRLEEMRFWTDPVVAPEGRQDGRQVIFDGQSLALRRSWGPWMMRETVGGQQDLLLRGAHDIGPSILEAFSPYMVFRPDPEGETTLFGMPVRWERVGLDSAVRPRPMEKEALNALREHEDDWKVWLAASHKPIEISGRVARRIDGDKGLVAGELSVKGIGAWGDEKRDFMALVNYDIGPLPPHISFKLPDEALAPRRERPWRMVKDALGDDLLSPYRP